MVYCFSDLAVDALRENLSIPVVGPGAVALAAADMLSNRFTVVTTVERNVSRTLRRLKQNPLCREKMAGVRALNIPVAELRDDPKATMRYLSKLCQKAVRRPGGYLGAGAAWGWQSTAMLWSRSLALKSLTPLSWRWPGRRWLPA